MGAGTVLDGWAPGSCPNDSEAANANADTVNLITLLRMLQVESVLTNRLTGSSGEVVEVGSKVGAELAALEGARESAV